MNKKLVLSVLSTAVVASMASAAMAKPGAGLYLGGDVDKYYSTDAFLSDTNFDNALDQLIDALPDVVFVNDEGKGANIQDILALPADGDVSSVLHALSKADFGDNTYTAINEDGSEGEPYIPANDSDLGDVPADLQVESVSAITKTGVEVKFAAALAADVKGATVEVKDNNGNVVPVVAQDLVKGETSASFDFVTALSADPTGVWKVNGVSFNLDDVKKFNDIITAATSGNEVTTLAALKAAGLTDVKDDYITAYVSAIQAANTAGTLATLADIQALIKTTNDTALSGAEQQAAVDAVNNATNQVQLLSALQGKAFARVNADWIVGYQTAINTAKATPTNTDTVAEIQALVDGVNSAKITAADTAAATSADQNAVTALIQAYTPDDVAPATTKADAIKASQVKAGVFKVKEATTQGTLYSALTALSSLDSTNLPVASLNGNLKAEYLTAKNAYTITGATTVAQIKTNVVDVAQAAAETAAIAAIDGLTSASTDAQVKAALQKLATVTASGATKFDMATVKDANLNKYVTATTAADGFDGFDAGNIATVADVQTVISSVNAVADLGTSLAAISSTSSTAAQVKDALTNVALATSPATTATTTYLDASSQVKLEVAQFIVDNRASLANPLTAATITADGGTGYGDAALETALAAHATKVGQFNAIGDLSAATISSVKAALDTYAYAPYVALTGTQKVAVAEYISKLTKDVSGTATPLNFGGADAVTTLAKANQYIDAAIAATK